MQLHLGYISLWFNPLVTCHELVWLFYPEGSYYTTGIPLQDLESLFWTYYLQQINYRRKLTCLDVVHSSVITDLFAYRACRFCLCHSPSSSDMDAHERSPGGRTVPDGAVDIDQQSWPFCSYLLAAIMWTSTEVCLPYWVPPTQIQFVHVDSNR